MNFDELYSGKHEVSLCHEVVYGSDAPSIGPGLKVSHIEYFRGFGGDSATGIFWVQCAGSCYLLSRNVLNRFDPDDFRPMKLAKADFIALADKLVVNSIRRSAFALFIFRGFGNEYRNFGKLDAWAKGTGFEPVDEILKETNGLICWDSQILKLINLFTNEAEIASQYIRQYNTRRYGYKELLEGVTMPTGQSLSDFIEAHRAREFTEKIEWYTFASTALLAWYRQRISVELAPTP